MADVKKIFISIPDYSDINKYNERYKQAISYLDKFMMGQPYELLNPRDIEPEANQLAHMSKILALMSQADWVYFTLNWDTYRKCKFENQCAQEYSKQTIYEAEPVKTTILYPIKEE